VWTATHAEEEHGKPHPRSVLCAVDDGAGSADLMQWAEAFSAHLGARLSLLHVVEPITDWPSLEHERARQDQFRLEARAKMESIQTTAGVVAPLRVAVGDIVTAVAEDAWQEDADLVVIGRGSTSETRGRWRTHAWHQPALAVPGAERLALAQAPQTHGTHTTFDLRTETCLRWYRSCT
jgi:nucleotide-binding universal stress UspA family protein